MITSEVKVSIPEKKRSQAEGLPRAGALVALMCLVLSALASVPFFFISTPYPGSESKAIAMPITHDMHLHFEQMKSFYRGLSDGEIYPRWEEDTNRGFGAPTTSYYPPAIYYVTSLFFFVFKDWWSALLATHLLITLLSGGALYLYARRLMSRLAASVAMAAYIFLPYRLIDQYQRGALAELLGFIWMPLMLLFCERLFRHEREEDEATPSNSRKRDWASISGLALSYGLFLWSHPPTAYQFTLCFGVYALVYGAMRRDLRGLIAVGVALAIGAGLSAAYMLPAFIEQDLIRHEYVSEAWPYHASYVFLHGPPYSQQPAHRGFFNLIDATWSFGTFTMALSAILLLKLRKRATNISNRLSSRVPLWLVAGVAASFMMLAVSEPVGRLIPRIEIGVFTWRMLSITTLVTALLAGASAEAALKSFGRRRKLVRSAFASVALLISIGGLIISLTAVAGPVFGSISFTPSEEHVNFATIPKTAPEDPLELPHVERVRIEGAAGRVSIERWASEKRVFQVELSAPARVLIRTFNFPGWTATVNGEVAQVITGDELGDIVLELPEGQHSINLVFADTRPRRAGRIISYGALAAVALLGFLPAAIGRDPTAGG